MTREEYIAIPALNFSRAKYLLKSAAHFKAAYEEEKEATEAQMIGTICHAMVLEGKDLRSSYAIKPKGMSFSSNEGKAWRAAQTLPIIKEDDSDSVPFIAGAIVDNPDAHAALKGCTEREHAITGTIHGVACKALIDCLGTDGATWALGDFKTTVDASPEEFAKTIYRNDYDMQAAWSSSLLAQREGLEEPPWFFWIAAEKKAPWFNAVYTPTRDFLASGHRKIERALTLWKECKASGKWPFAVQGVTELTPPRWAA